MAILKIKSLFCKLCVFFVGFFFINELLAFDVAMTDKSRQYLGMIFGGTVGPIVLSDEHNVVIGRLFSQLNTVIFVLGTLMVGYITVVSTLNTAKEGHAMGQKWSSMWVPVRAVLGLLVMVPTPVSGYSTIQVTVMWFVLQGIGAANSVWNVALDALSSGLSVTAVKGFAGTPDSSVLSLSDSQLSQLQSIMQASFQAAVCTKFVNRFVEINQSDPLQMTRYTSQNTGGGQVSFYQDPSDLPMIKIGFQGGSTSVGGVDFTKICGRAYIQCSTSNANGSCSDSTKTSLIYQGLNSVYESMLDLAEPFFSEIDGLTKPLNYQSSADDLTSKLSAESGLYETDLTQLKNTIFQMTTSANTGISDAISSARTLGWIHAGSYYMMLNNVATASINSRDYSLMDPNYGTVDSSVGTDTLSYLDYKNITSTDVNSILSLVNTNFSLPVNATLSYDSPIYAMMTLYSSSDAAKVSGSNLSKFFNSLLISASSVISHSETQTGLSAVGGGTVDSSLASSNRVGITASGAVKKFQSWINRTTDPLLGISMFGASLMTTAEAMLAIAYAASVALSFGGIMACPVSFKGVMDQLITGIMFPATTAAVLLWTTGATFAVYMPMIPYLMFTATAVGWMFAVIESVVAAPILALGFVSPSGDELGKAGQGVLMLVSLFMKPTLMILSFILASRLLKAILTMVNNMFVATLDASISGVSVLFGWVVPMTLYAGFVITLTNKCFALIHILPDKVMKWIGAQGEGFAVEEVMQKTEAKAQEGAGAAQGMMKGAAESAQKKISDAKKNE